GSSATGAGGPTTAAGGVDAVTGGGAADGAAEVLGFAGAGGVVVVVVAVAVAGAAEGLALAAPGPAYPRGARSNKHSPTARAAKHPRARPAVRRARPEGVGVSRARFMFRGVRDDNGCGKAARYMK
ncbi:MAG: hypothetical protein HOW73_39360, partial [Polyangiaceae bacterium]|nr:hypothetical protein [Polyangiaceae bacterium]